VGQSYELGYGVSSLDLKHGNMENMDAAPPGAAAQNLVGSVDYMSFMDRPEYTVSNNPRSMDASMKPPTSTIKLFPNVTLTPPT
jgi:hypothetical protein